MDNEQQPGQSFLPPQQPQYVPQTPDSAQSPQSQQQPQQPYQQPAQPPQQPQNPTSPMQQPSVGPSKLQIKKIGIVAGVFLAVVALIAVMASQFGGGGDLVQVTTDDLDFNVSLPKDWEVETSSVSILSVLNATPPNVPSSDGTRISIVHELTPVDEAGLLQKVNEDFADLQSSEYQDGFEIDITNADSQEFTGVEQLTFLTTYNSASRGAELTHTVERYSVLQPDNSAVSAVFVYSDEYAGDLKPLITSILQSYSAK